MMTKSILNRRGFIHGAATIGALAASPAMAQPKGTETKTPGLTTDMLKKARPPFRGGFQHVFDPSAGEKEALYLNDHCFIQASDGTWHLFGITHQEPANPDHESFFLHATAKDVKGP